MAVDNRMVLLTSVNASKDQDDLNTAGLLIGELALNANTGVLFAGGDPGGAAGAAPGSAVANAADILGIKLSAASTAQALGTGDSPSFAGLTSTGTFTHDSVGISAIQTSSESFADNNTSLMTSAAILDKIQAESGTATNATNSSHVLVTDNENTNEENLITFVEDATDSTGNVGLEMDGNLTYNPSAGRLTATAFAGALTGNVTGNASGSSGSCTGNAATATKLAATKTIAGVAFDGSSNISLNNNAITNGAGYVTANDDVSAANLLTRLAAYTGDDTVIIGDAGDDCTVQIRGTLQVDGATTTINSTTMTVDDKNIVLASGAANDAAADGAGITIDGADATLLYEATGDQFEFNKEVNASAGFVGNLTGNVTGNVTGNTSGSSGSCTGNAATASVATTVTITDNENTNENNALIFTAGGDTDGGNLGLESDGTCTYNPSTGKITATGFIGTLTGNVTGNTSGSSGSCTGNAATATALATGRTFLTDLGETNASAAFDGTGNISDIGVTGTLVVGNGGTGATSLTDGGILLGSGTGAITAMAVLADGEMIVGDGTTDPVAESGATLRTSIGVGTGNSPQFTGVNLGHASDTTLTRSAAGKLAVEGVDVCLLTGAQTLAAKTISGGTF